MPNFSQGSNYSLEFCKSNDSAISRGGFHDGISRVAKFSDVAIYQELSVVTIYISTAYADLSNCNVMLDRLSYFLSPGQNGTLSCFIIG